MAYTLKLETFSHDIRIKNGKVVRISGADEVRQRIKIAMYHELGEYFLNTESGVPWYSQILGSKMEKVDLANLLRQKILQVPGVLRVDKIEVTKKVRDYFISTVCQVRSDGAEPQTVQLTNIAVGG